MKLLICGSRSMPKSRFEAMLKAVLSLYDPNTGVGKPTQIINGGATGADALATKVAVTLNIPYLILPARWENGKRAGHDRNQEMVNLKPDLVLAWFCPDIGLTPGTADMLKRTQAAGIPFQLIAYEEDKNDKAGTSSGG